MAENGNATTGTELVEEIRAFLGVMDSALSEGVWHRNALSVIHAFKVLDTLLSNSEPLPEQWKNARRVTGANDLNWDPWSHKFVRGPVLGQNID